MIEENVINSNTHTHTHTQKLKTSKQTKIIRKKPEESTILGIWSK